MQGASEPVALAGNPLRSLPSPVWLSFAAFTSFSRAGTQQFTGSARPASIMTDMADRKASLRVLFMLLPINTVFAY